MDSKDDVGEATPPRENRTRNTEALAEAARRLPQVVKDVDRLHAAWAVLMSAKTPRWKRVVVALEVARLMIATRLRKAPPVPVGDPLKTASATDKM